MSERFTFVKRAATAAVAVGLTTAALAGCAEPDSHDDWMFEVTCPEATELEVTSVRSGVSYGPDTIDVTCDSDVAGDTPIIIELLAGPGVETEVLNPTSPLGSNKRVLEVQTTSASGGLFFSDQSPQLGEEYIDEAQDEIKIEFLGIQSIDRVSVTTPGLETAPTTKD